MQPKHELTNKCTLYTDLQLLFIRTTFTQKNFLYYPLIGVFQGILKNLKNSFSYRTSPAVASAVIQMDCPTILFLVLCVIFHYNSSFVFTTFQISVLEISPKKQKYKTDKKYSNFWSYYLNMTKNPC